MIILMETRWRAVSYTHLMPDGVVAYTIDNDTEKVFVAYNAGKNKITIKLADALWEVLADEASAGDKALYTIKDQAIIPVSYTHLDVYKRQLVSLLL